MNQIKDCKDSEKTIRKKLKIKPRQVANPNRGGR
jgi:hypothetical protein